MIQVGKLTWLDVDTLFDKFQDVSQEFQWAIQTDDIHMYKDILIQTYLLFSSSKKPKKISIPKSMKLLPGIVKKIQEWYDEDDISADFSKVFDSLDEIQVEYVKNCVAREMKDIMYFIRNPSAFQESEVFYLNVWVLFCKHMLKDDIYIDETIISYQVYQKVLNAVFRFMLKNTPKTSSQIGVLNDSELDHYQAMNLEIERERFFKNRGDDGDKVLKKYKLGEWAKGLQSVWKTVEDYEENEDIPQVMTENPDQILDEVGIDEDLNEGEEWMPMMEEDGGDNSNNYDL